MSDKNSTGNHNDEIDLLQLFRSFGDFIVSIFKGIFNIILQIIIFSIRKWVYLLLALIFGIGVSYLFTKIQQDYYYSDLVLKSNAVQNQEMISYINRLQSLTSEGNSEVLAASLDLTTEEAEMIGDIRAYWFVDKNKDKIVDDIDINNRFLGDTSITKVDWKFGIRATVTDPLVFKMITTGIDYYVNSNEYFILMNELRLENLEEIIVQTGNEVQKLDSLQKREYFMKEDQTRLKEGQLVFTNDPEIKLRHKDLLGLVKDRQVNQRELTIHDGVISLLEDFTITQRPANSITFYARKFVPAFILFVYILALYITFRKRIAEVIRK